MSSLTPQAIQDAALSLVEEHGAAKLTMRRLAERLGVEAPSLYHHVANKAALVDHVLDAVAAQATAPDPELGWEEHILALAQGWRDLLAAHPNAVGLFGARPSRAMGLLAASPDSQTVLEDAGFSADVAADMLRTLVVLAIGHAEATQAGAGGDDPDAWLDRTLAACIVGAQALSSGDVVLSPRFATEVDEHSGSSADGDASGGEDADETSDGPGGDEVGQDADSEHVHADSAADGPAADETAPEPAAPEPAPAEPAPAAVVEQPAAAEPAPAAVVEEPAAAEPAPAAVVEEPPAAKPTPRPAAPPPRPPPARPASRPEPARRGGIASRLLRRAGSLLGGDDD